MPHASSLVAIVTLLGLALSLLVVVAALAAGVVERILGRLSQGSTRVEETVGADPHDPTETALPDDPRED